MVSYILCSLHLPPPCPTVGIGRQPAVAGFTGETPAHVPCRFSSQQNVRPTKIFGTKGTTDTRSPDQESLNALLSTLAFLR